MMKNLYLLLFVSLLASTLFSQRNPYKSLGVEVEVLTLSKGKYKEVFDDERYVQIGSIIYDIEEKRLVRLLNKDSIPENFYILPLSDSRWISPDPLADEFESVSPYNFGNNNPIRFNDPTGLAPESPIYGEDGQFLGVDSEGFQGDVIVMNKYIFEKLSNSGAKTLDHSFVSNLVKNTSVANLTNEANLTPEAYSKITTHVLSKMDDIDISDLHNSQISVLDRNLGESYNDPENVLGLAETTVTNEGKIKVTANLYSGQADSDLQTVANIQNNLGAHEFIGHGKKGFGDKTRTHHKVYEFQMRHPTWKQTTKSYQSLMTEYYQEYKKRETGN